MTNQNPTQLCLCLQAREGGGAEAGDGGPGRGRAAAGTQPGGTPGQVRRLGLCRRRRRPRVITAGAGGCAGPAHGASLNPRRGRQLLRVHMPHNCPGSFMSCSRAGPGQAVGGSSSSGGGGGEAGAGTQLEDVGHAFEEFLRFAEELQEEMVPGVASCCSQCLAAVCSSGCLCTAARAAAAAGLAWQLLRAACSQHGMTARWLTARPTPCGAGCLGCRGHAP